MNGGEHDPAAGPIEKLAQMLAPAGLHRRLAEDVRAALELTEKLVVQVVAVGQHHQRRVLHRRMPHHAGGEEEHGETLAAALRVPDDTRTTVARLASMHATRPVGALVFSKHARWLDHAAGPHGFLHRGIHRVKLMVTRDDLVQCTRVRIFLEDDEMVQ